MRIGLVDVDGHNYPNLALMKLSAWHKAKGDTVEWYSPASYWEGIRYDIVYKSKVFSDTYTKDTPDPLNADLIIRGGTGYAIKLEDGKEVYHKELDPPLDTEIEHTFPDYSLYPELTGYGQPPRKQTAYGYMTRGCPRGCAFCHVAPKEGRASIKVADLKEFWNGQGMIKLSDPNVLACRERNDVLEQLAESGAKVDFNQGLDARLINGETAQLLARIDLTNVHFAMDRMKDVEAVAEGLKFYREHFMRQHEGHWRCRDNAVFLLTNFDTTFTDDMARIETLKALDYRPFVMIYNKNEAPRITRRLQQWCNNPLMYFGYKDFWDFQKDRYKEVVRG